MAYATQDDLVPQRLSATQLLQLTTDPGATVPDASVVSSVLAKASAIVDGYCGQRYTTPLQNSTIATELTADIATYRLYQRRGQVKAGTAQEVAYRDAISLLVKISEGTASLDVPANALPQTSSGGPVVTQIPQVFTRPYGSECCEEDGWL